MQIRSKLTLLLLGIGTLTGVAIGVVSYWQFRQNTIRRVEAQLTGVRRSKAFQVEAYFRTIHQHVMTLSQEVTFVEGAKQLQLEYSKLNRARVNEQEYRNALRNYYVTEYMPALGKLVDLRPNVDDYLPGHPAGLYLQNSYILQNPYRYAERSKLQAADDGSAYSSAHARAFTIPIAGSEKLSAIQI